MTLALVRLQGSPEETVMLKILPYRVPGYTMKCYNLTDNAEAITIPTSKWLT